MKLFRKWKSLALVALTSYTLSGCGGSENYVFSAAPAPLPVQVNSKLLAVYMVGSDLETRDGAGSTDLQEMVDGLKSMSAGEREELDLVIAFGGAKKDGWQGMTWMDADQLLADAQDGTFGNETGQDSYLYRDESVNMAEPATLTRFLSFLATNYAVQDQRFVVLWNHGSGYGGFGVDEVFRKILSLDELDEAFRASGLPKVELLGFDACLMASLEVAKSLHEHGRFLVASEELEPVHGWNYRYVVPNFVRIDAAKDYGIGLCNDFIDSRNHPYPADGKTLSLLDLDQTNHVVAALDGFSVPYSEGMSSISSVATGFVRAVTSTQLFGGRGDSKVSMDLIDFLEKSLFFGSVTQQQSQGLLQALESFVVHTADDGTRETVTGVSIVVPDETGRNLDLKYFPGQGWLALTKAGVALKEGDRNPPELRFAERTAEGLLAAFVDPLLTEVTALYGLRDSDGFMLAFELAEASPIPGDERWLAPLWDGQVYHLNYDAQAAPLPMPLSYEGSGRMADGGEAELYEAEIEFLDSSDGDTAFRKGTLSFFFREGVLISHQVTTFLTTEGGQFVPDRNKDHLDIGDRIRFFSSVYRSGPQEDSESVFRQFGPEVVIATVPTVKRQTLVAPAGNTAVFAVAGEDFGGNVTLSELFEL